MNCPLNVICVHTCMQCGLMCGIWDWQSTIVGDLNDSQDPKHTLFCRENAFVAIYALFQTTNVPFLPVYGGGSPKGDNVTFFTVFLYQGSPKCELLEKIRMIYREKYLNACDIQKIYLRFSFILQNPDKL